jgi:hypothetical protein
MYGTVTAPGLEGRAHAGVARDEALYERRRREARRFPAERTAQGNSRAKSQVRPPESSDIICRAPRDPHPPGGLSASEFCKHDEVLTSPLKSYRGAGPCCPDFGVFAKSLGNPSFPCAQLSESNWGLPRLSIRRRSASALHPRLLCSNISPTTRRFYGVSLVSPAVLGR